MLKTNHEDMLSLTAPIVPVHHAAMLLNTGILLLAAQTLAEYGVINSIRASFAAARYHLEIYVGPGNLKYVLLAVLTVIVILVVRRRR